MKRTALRRKTRLESRSTLKRSPLRAQPNAQRNAQNTQPSCRKVQKAAHKPSQRWRSEAYLRWVRRMPCCCCAGPGGDAHHVIGLHWGLSGEGLTAPDSYAMPLCRRCHDEVHRSPELQQRQPQWLRLTIARGVRQFDGETRAQLLQAEQYINLRAGGGV